MRIFNIGPIEEHHNSNKRVVILNRHVWVTSKEILNTQKKKPVQPPHCETWASVSSTHRRDCTYAIWETSSTWHEGSSVILVPRFRYFSTKLYLSKVYPYVEQEWHLFSIFEWLLSRCCIYSAYSARYTPRVPCFLSRKRRPLSCESGDPYSSRLLPAIHSNFNY